ncbi:hypothetical protein [Pseudoxanthomonas wuyuanensis]|uniref:Uncharacterized protein n=1 Tax=Pseudoxanthomonas wuyuanensis TaxID=1073196 RepID=A0A286CWK0_9GAMM|nr:hypothetical protein [Pseudoxanthomonas wuyuanensis]KAF1720917.1 hypothetical protein CSC75_09520 [Pseudoxanthomonas wuyuanensis]SOD50776.1 hypothetical protein SAMN06296416_101317 [Pseudoxanthomonas wuyuanensis]
MPEFEKVIELVDYYDGPREGLANFQGKPHTFKSRMLDVYGADDAIDLFDLAPVGLDGPTVVARAEFRRVGSGPQPPGEWPVHAVRWALVSADGA